MGKVTVSTYPGTPFRGVFLKSKRSFTPKRTARNGVPGYVLASYGHTIECA